MRQGWKIGEIWVVSGGENLPTSGGRKQNGGLDPKLHAQRLLRPTEVLSMVGLKRSSIYRYVAEGRFPPPIRVGERSVKSKLADVLAWRASIDQTQ
jgi:prophage regulatory protein